MATNVPALEDKVDLFRTGCCHAPNGALEPTRQGVNRHQTETHQPILGFAGPPTLYFQMGFQTASQRCQLLANRLQVRRGLCQLTGQQLGRRVTVEL